MNGYIIYNKQTDVIVATYADGEQTSDQVLSANGFDTDIVACVRFPIDPLYTVSDYSIGAGSLVKAVLTSSELGVRSLEKVQQSNPVLVKMILDEINLIRSEANLPARTLADALGRP